MDNRQEERVARAISDAERDWHKRLGIRDIMAGLPDDMEALNIAMARAAIAAIDQEEMVELMKGDALYKTRDGFESSLEGAHVFIQWKGTDVCCDFHCDCGEHHHIDADFVYAIKCTCGRTFEMPHTVAVQLVEKATGCVYHCTDDEC